MNRKYIAILLMFVFVFLLPACGGQKNVETEATEILETTEDATETLPPVVTITSDDFPEGEGIVGYLVTTEPNEMNEEDNREDSSPKPTTPKPTTPKPTTPKPTEPEATKPTTPKPTTPEPTQPTETEVTTKPTEAPKPTEPQETTKPTEAPKPTEPPVSDGPCCDYEEYLALSPAEQEAYMRTFSNPMDFIEWSKKAEAEHNAHDDTIIVEGGNLDIGDYMK